MNDGHAVGEFRQEERFFHGAVAATDDEDVVTTVERTVTGRTRREAVAHQVVLAVSADPAGARAGGNNQGTRSDSVTAREGEFERLVLEVGSVDGAVSKLSPKRSACALPC